jgi:predicted kinase
MQSSRPSRDDATQPGRALVIVTGLPASGKSTFVARLALRTGLEAIAKDALKEALFARLGTGDAAWSRQLSDAAFAGLFAQAAARLGSGADAAIEGNFRAGEHERAILEACQVAGAATRIAQVLCRIDEPRRIARLAARVASGARHAGHLDAEALAATRAGRAAGPGAPSDRFLDLPGERFVYDSGLDPQAAALDRLVDGLASWLAGR